MHLPTTPWTLLSWWAHKQQPFFEEPHWFATWKKTTTKITLHVVCNTKVCQEQQTLFFWCVYCMRITTSACQAMLHLLYHYMSNTQCKAVSGLSLHAPASTFFSRRRRSDAMFGRHNWALNFQIFHLLSHRCRHVILAFAALRDSLQSAPIVPQILVTIFWKIRSIGGSRTFENRNTKGTERKGTEGKEKIILRFTRKRRKEFWCLRGKGRDLRFQRKWEVYFKSEDLRFEV